MKDPRVRTEEVEDDDEVIYLLKDVCTVSNSGCSPRPNPRHIGLGDRASAAHLHAFLRFVDAKVPWQSHVLQQRSED